MKLKFKLLLSIILLGSTLLLIGGFSYFSLSKATVVKQVLKDDKENVIYIAEAIENDLLELVRLTTTIASTDVIKDSLLASNTEFSLLTVSERDEYIDELDTQWINTDDISDPFIKTRMENDVASFLLSLQNDSPELYGELFLTNEHGVMISTTGKLTTLAHAEKYWWEEAYNDGDGIVYLDDRGFDASVEGYVLGIVVPVYDDFGNIIGILKSNYNISNIFENCIASFHDLNSEGENYVVRTLGLIVDGGNFEPLSNSISDDVLPYIEERVDLSIEASIDGESSFLTIAPIDLTYSSNIVSFGGKYESIDHSVGNLGEGWSVVHIVAEKVALKELGNSWILFTAIGFGMLVLIGGSALYIGDRLSKPFKDLNTYINEVADGKLVRKDIRITDDEIGALTTSFNKLIDNLSLTLISKEKLENEIVIKEKLKKVLQVSEKRYRELVNNLEAGVIVHAADTSVIMNNGKACELLGLSEEVLKGKKAIDPSWKFVREDLEPLPIGEYPINIVISSGKQIKNVILGVYNPVFSEIVWLSVNGTPYIDKQGDIKEVIISFFNVTELTKKQKSLLDSFDRLDRSQKISNVGSWELDLNTNLIWASQEAFDIYGLTRDSEYIDINSIEKMVSKEERTMLNKALLGLVQNGEPYDLFFTLNVGSKKKYLNSKASVSKNSLGKPNKVLGVISDITDSKYKEDELISMSFHDSLTGLKNRRAIKDTLESFNTAVMIDIDDFKEVNDTYGHYIGDEVLEKLSRRLEDVVRQADVVVRWGGEEFLVLMTNVDKKSTCIATKRIFNAFKEPLIIKENEILITASMGVACSFEMPTNEMNKVINAADKAMYASKNNGKNQVTMYSDKFK